MWGQARHVMRMVFAGPQVLGLRSRLAVHLRRARREAADSELARGLKGLTHALAQCRGSWQAESLSGLACRWPGAAANRGR